MIVNYAFGKELEMILKIIVIIFLDLLCTEHCIKCLMLAL